mmetsp:Transcript_38233/g.89739  ORF Transcript_38233/g.89739 Transcript_38233/m.89739 type:complete len:123 (-) Transcript_38233:82-450(-)
MFLCSFPPPGPRNEVGETFGSSTLATAKAAESDGPPRKWQPGRDIVFDRKPFDHGGVCCARLGNKSVGKGWHKRWLCKKLGQQHPYQHAGAEAMQHASACDLKERVPSDSRTRGGHAVRRQM